VGEAPVKGAVDRPVKIRGRREANYDPAINIAFICTGNICRSPMAEALLRARLVPVAPKLAVGSAGLLFDGRPAEPNAVRVMAKRGLDISDHRAQTISADRLHGTTLILGMERQHVREVAALEPDLFGRSFTLPELVQAGQIVGARQRGQRVADWAHSISQLRSPADYAKSDPLAEISDPMGGPLRSFRACADTIDAQLELLVGLIWPKLPPRDRLVAPATSGGIHADRDRR
jgi:protein-tyrosine phosphatase